VSLETVAWILLGAAGGALLAAWFLRGRSSPDGRGATVGDPDGPAGPSGTDATALTPESGTSGSSIAASDPVGQPGGARPGGGRGLLAALPIGLIHFDPGLLLSYANPAAIAILGTDAASPGRTVMEVFLDPAVETMARASLSGTAGAVEMGWGDAAARRLVLRSRRSSQGGIWLIVEDVTELRRLQQIRAEFVENLSHELRTPLSSISLLAETLALEAQAPDSGVGPRMRDRIVKIEVETGHLVQMVAELLDLSRIESGSALILHDDVDLGRLATSSVDRLRLFAERQGVPLEVILDPDLPLVRGDEDRIGQVLVNLLHNAVKFSPDGGLVTVRVARDGGEVIVSVKDHGIGIPRADQPRIFERFYKVDRARVRGGGTGLGLAIARHIVEAHGGRIWLESELQRGSTFSFALPTEGRDGDPAAIGRVDASTADTDAALARPDDPVSDGTLWLAHRGDHRVHRENTLAAFRAASLIPGVDGVELDVRGSRDGIPVVIHDLTLERLFGVPSAVSDLDATALAGIGVPRLADTLMALPARAFVDVELKEDVVSSAVAVLRAIRGDPPARTVISSFEIDVLEAVRQAVPAWACWLNADDLSDRTVGLALELGCTGVSVELAGLTAARLDEARRSGLDVAAWTVRRRDELARLRGLDLFAICIEGEPLDDAPRRRAAQIRGA
jgi:signal transduction histidine kinase/glycerophosphoryl diester phosphodiesterase